MSQHFYPYQWLRDPGTLAVTTVRVDGARPDVDPLALAGTVDLSVLSPGWRQVLARLEVDFPPDKIESLADRVRIVATLNCQATNVRASVELKPTERRGRWVGELPIERSTLADRADITAVAAGTIDGVPDRYVGSTQPVQVVFAERQRPVSNNLLPVRWAEFSTYEHIPVEFRQENHYVDLVAETPTILLNNEIRELRNILSERGKVSPEVAAIRSLEMISIAVGAWTGLFNAAVSAINNDEEEGAPQPPALPWQRKVLDTLLPAIYPNSDADSLLVRVTEDASDPEGAVILQSRLQAVISKQIRITSRFRRMIDRIELNAVDATDVEETR